MDTALKPPGRLGVEIELGGLSLDDVAAVAAAELGGAVSSSSRFVRLVDSPWGELRIEVDSRPVKELGERMSPPGDPVGDATADAIESVATTVVPIEIVTSPMPRADLHRLDRLCEALARAGGRSTFDGPQYAFGVHFNAEVVEPTAELLLAHLQAFAVLYEHLSAGRRVNWSRRLSPFVDPYPDDYAAHIMPDDYAPDLGELIDDYLRYNPTRNRALDMLPMFMHLDEARVRAAIDVEAVKARPTFHYRLANSCIGDEGWSVSSEWVAWVAVELLATQPDLLARARRQFLRRHERSWLDSVKAAVAG